jgi:hypothetical protein
MIRPITTCDVDSQELAPRSRLAAAGGERVDGANPPRQIDNFSPHQTIDEPLLRAWVIVAMREERARREGNVENRLFSWESASSRPQASCAACRGANQDVGAQSTSVGPRPAAAVSGMGAGRRAEKTLRFFQEFAQCEFCFDRISGLDWCEVRSRPVSLDPDYMLS